MKIYYKETPPNYKGELLAKMKEKPTVPEILKLVINLCEKLMEIHEEGYLNLNLNLHNVLFNSEGVEILSKYNSIEFQNHKLANHKLSVSKGFIAPEILLQNQNKREYPIGKHTDAFSVVKIFMSLLCGTNNYEEVTLYNVLKSENVQNLSQNAQSKIKTVIVNSCNRIATRKNIYPTIKELMNDFKILESLINKGKTQNWIMRWKIKSQ